MQITPKNAQTSFPSLVRCKRNCACSANPAELHLHHVQSSAWKHIIAYSREGL